MSGSLQSFATWPEYGLEAGGCQRKEGCTLDSTAMPIRRVQRAENNIFSERQRRFPKQISGAG